VRRADPTRLYYVLEFLLAMPTWVAMAVYLVSVLHFSPLQLVLMGTGACSAVDVVLILRRARQEIRDCVVELDADRAAADPKVFTRIHFHYIVSGKTLNESQVARAIELSKEKYCSATAMLAHTAQVTSDYEIRDA